jgi:hypothetical protein
MSSAPATATVPGTPRRLRALRVPPRVALKKDLLELKRITGRLATGERLAPADVQRARSLVRRLLETVDQLHANRITTAETEVMTNPQPIVVANHQPTLKIARPVREGDQFTDIVLEPVIAWAIYQEAKPAADPFFEASYFLVKPIGIDGESDIAGAVIFDLTSQEWYEPNMASGIGRDSLIARFREWSLARAQSEKTRTEGIGLRET